MSKRILFSAVGGHDPIANFRDGAMLHICRKYKPQQVYLYLSKEKVELEEADQRFTKSLHLLKEEEGFEIEGIEVIKKKDLVDVHLFDVFYTEFEEILRTIVKDNPGCELYVNLSSGTPAMKNALNLIACLSSYKIAPVQVATPNKSENQSSKEFILADHWECNLDREVGELSRCEEIKNENLLAKVNKEIIIKMINAYDYAAALEVAVDIEGLLSNEVMNMLRFAKCRLMMDGSGMSKNLDENTKVLLPIQTGNEKAIFEYVLTLQIREKRGDYADFIRAITPVVLDIFEECLKNKFGIDIRKVCIKRKSRKGDNDIYYLDYEEMKKTELGQRCMKYIETALKGREFKPQPYNSMHMMWILEGLSKDPEQAKKMDSKLLQNVQEIREIESEARNVPAHEIVSVTEEWLQKKVGQTASEILKLIKELTVQAGINVKKEYWNSYEDMNEKIRAMLKI